MREYHYRVDGDGRVFHDGSEIVDAATLRFFLLGMRREPDGRWLVPCQGEQNWFAAEDTPFVVQRLRLDVADGRLRRIGLVLAGDLQEPLDPAASRPRAAGSIAVCAAAPSARASAGSPCSSSRPIWRRSAGRVTLLLDGGRHPIPDARARTGGVHVG